MQKLLIIFFFQIIFSSIISAKSNIDYFNSNKISFNQIDKKNIPIKLYFNKYNLIFQYTNKTEPNLKEYIIPIFMKIEWFIYPKTTPLYTQRFEIKPNKKQYFKGIITNRFRKYTIKLYINNEEVIIPPYIAIRKTHKLIIGNMNLNITLRHSTNNKKISKYLTIFQNKNIHIRDNNKTSLQKNKQLDNILIPEVYFPYNKIE